MKDGETPILDQLMARGDSAMRDLRRAIDERLAMAERNRQMAVRDRITPIRWVRPKRT